MNMSQKKWIPVALSWFVCSGAVMVANGEICSAVVMQVQQEATLVRQGFDAHMHIDNALPVALSDLSVKVVITDAEGNSVLQTSDPDDLVAEFFVRVDQTEGAGLAAGAESVSNGVVAASSSADMNWLIIPTLNAGVSNQNGEVFYVGAELTYTVDGKEKILNVTPDSILVKPLPDLSLDYFLPGLVYGDDPATEGILEPVEPFSLGVLVRNTGYGTAKNMKISSGQPQIVHNQQGLLVGFKILGTEVNGKTAANSLLVDFGTVDPARVAIARWTMACSMSGEFVAFKADFTHADELGGMVTSLIQPDNMHSHILLRDVLVDLPGRDGIRDFLTSDLELYESEGTIIDVTNLTSIATLVATNDFFVLKNQPQNLSGPAYFSAPIAEANRHILNRIVRSDGRPMRTENAWVSKQRESSESAWEYTLHLFDANPLAAGSYQVYFKAPEVISNAAPEWVGMDPQFAYANRTLQFTVHATDDDGTTPQLSAVSKPAASTFTNYANGYGYFSWTPDSVNAGTTMVTFAAADGYTSTPMNVMITVRDWNIPTNCPAWWYDHDLIVTNAVANDFAPVNQGQLKNIAWWAYKEMEKLQGGTNGTGGAGFELAVAVTNNYLPVNIGQAKMVANNFYTRLGMTFPYSTNNVQTNDFAMANIGQIKNLFSFDPLKDSNTNGIPDWWEELYSSTNRSAYFNNTHP